LGHFFKKILGVKDNGMDQYEQERELMYMHKANVRFLREFPGLDHEDEFFYFDFGA